MYVIQDKEMKNSYFLKFSDDGKYWTSVGLKSNAMQFKEYKEAEDFIKNNLSFPEDYRVVKV